MFHSGRERNLFGFATTGLVTNCFISMRSLEELWVWTAVFGFLEIPGIARTSGISRIPEISEILEIL